MILLEISTVTLTSIATDNARFQVTSYLSDVAACVKEGTVKLKLKLLKGMVSPIQNRASSLQSSTC